MTGQSRSSGLSAAYSGDIICPRHFYRLTGPFLEDGQKVRSASKSLPEAEAKIED